VFAYVHVCERVGAFYVTVWRNKKYGPTRISVVFIPHLTDSDKGYKKHMI